MTIRLTPDQERLVESAVAEGLAHSAEDFVSEALQEKLDSAALARFVRDEVIPGHEEYLRDPSRAVPAEHILREIKRRRKTHDEGK